MITVSSCLVYFSVLHGHLTSADSLFGRTLIEDTSSIFNIMVKSSISQGPLLFRDGLSHGFRSEDDGSADPNYLGGFLLYIQASCPDLYPID